MSTNQLIPANIPQDLARIGPLSLYCLPLILLVRKQHANFCYGILDSSPNSPLERLPVLVLDRICECIDDESATPQNLQAFFRTSRSLRTAADVRRYSQIEFLVRDPDRLEGTLKRWNEVLTDGRQRHVGTRRNTGSR